MISLTDSHDRHLQERLVRRSTITNIIFARDRCPQEINHSPISVRFSSKWISEFSCFLIRVFLKEAFARDFCESSSQNEYCTERHLERIPSSCRGTSRSRFRVSEPRARRRGGVPTPNDAEAVRRTSENRCEDVHPRRPLYPPARRHAIAPAHELALACSSMCTGCRGLTPRHVSRK